MEGLAQYRVDTADWEMDHICYRVENRERYLEVRASLDQLGTLLSEANISGREIASYALDQPILFEGKSIPLIEIPAPKAESPYPEGYEHVEFVVNESLETFVACHPWIAFDVKGMHKVVNPEVRLPLGVLSVKFHTQSLAEVIRNEQAS